MNNLKILITKCPLEKNCNKFNIEGHDIFYTGFGTPNFKLFSPEMSLGELSNKLTGASSCEGDGIFNIKSIGKTYCLNNYKTIYCNNSYNYEYNLGSNFSRQESEMHLDEYLYITGVIFMIEKRIYVIKTWTTSIRDFQFERFDFMGDNYEITSFIGDTVTNSRYNRIYEFYKNKTKTIHTDPIKFIEELVKKSLNDNCSNKGEFIKIERDNKNSSIDMTIIINFNGWNKKSNPFNIGFDNHIIKDIKTIINESITNSSNFIDLSLAEINSSEKLSKTIENNELIINAFSKRIDFLEDRLKNANVIVEKYNRIVNEIGR